MADPIVTPAVERFKQMCAQFEAGWCRWVGHGYRVNVFTWPEDPQSLIELLNGMPISDLYLSVPTITDRHFSLFKNTHTWESLTLSCLPIDGSGFDLLDPCVRVDRLELRNCPVDGRQMIGLRRFPNASIVQISGVSAADDAIRYLSAVNELKSLLITRSSPDFTGDGFEGLAGKQHLRIIEIIDCSVSRGFEHLTNCPSLEVISLGDTDVDDAALFNISKVKSLKALSVYSDKVTDDGLAHFAGHPHLGEIEYMGRGPEGQHRYITEEFFSHLLQIPNLDSLTVACQVSSRGVSVLKKIPKLNYLCLMWPTLTQSEFDEIRLQFPNCRVCCSFLDDAEREDEYDDE